MRSQKVSVRVGKRFSLSVLLLGVGIFLAGSRVWAGDENPFQGVARFDLTLALGKKTSTVLQIASVYQQGQSRASLQPSEGAPEIILNGFAGPQARDALLEVLRQISHYGPAQLSINYEDTGAYRVLTRSIDQVSFTSYLPGVSKVPISLNSLVGRMNGTHLTFAKQKDEWFELSLEERAERVAQDVLLSGRKLTLVEWMEVALTQMEREAKGLRNVVVETEVRWIGGEPNPSYHPLWSPVADAHGETVIERMYRLQNLSKAFRRVLGEAIVADRYQFERQAKVNPESAAVLIARYDAIFSHPEQFKVGFKMIGKNPTHLEFGGYSIFKTEVPQDKWDQRDLMLTEPVGYLPGYLFSYEWDVEDRDLTILRAKQVSLCQISFRGE